MNLVHIHVEATDDPEENRRRLNAATKKAVTMGGGYIHLGPGTYAYQPGDSPPEGVTWQSVSAQQPAGLRFVEPSE
jgi:hypothetical protein